MHKWVRMDPNGCMGQWWMEAQVGAGGGCEGKIGAACVQGPGW